MIARLIGQEPVFGSDETPIALFATPLTPSGERDTQDGAGPDLHTGRGRGRYRRSPNLPTSRGRGRPRSILPRPAPVPLTISDLGAASSAAPPQVDFVWK